MDINRTTPLESLPVLLTVKEFLACVPIPRSTAYTLLRRQRIQSTRIGKRVYIKREAVAALFARKES